MNSSPGRTKPRGAARRSWPIRIGLLIGLLCACHFCPIGVLCLENEWERRVLWFQPLLPGDKVELLYEQSMYRVLQREIYTSDATGDFVLRKMVFGSFAAAAYYDPELSEKLICQGDSWEITSLRLTCHELKMFVNQSHRLFLGNQAINLAAEFGDGSRVCIKKYSYPQILFTLGLEQAKRLVKTHSALTAKGGTFDS